ncbi:AAA family ATPase [Vibrio parahaemolyticus]|nr:AAA family ATPase [Vibrio parahaemolyticus]EJE4163986.1 AAA family ATPase [Vibrio parahaemolyticus]
MNPTQIDLFSGNAVLSTELVKPTHKRFGNLKFSLGSAGFDAATEWLVKDLIPASSFGTIYGASGSLKTFLTLEVSCSVTTGKAWNNKPVQRGAVVYIAAEGQTGVAKRVKAWEIANGVETQNLYILGHSMNISDVDAVTTLAHSIKELEFNENVKVRLVVIDTLARCYSGDENTSRDMSAFVNGCDKIKSLIDTTVLCVHHSGRDESRGARGSSALRAACDFEFQVKRDGKSKILTFANTKQKEGNEAPDLELEFDSVDLGIQCEEKLPVTSLARVKPVKVKAERDYESDNPVLTLLSEKFDGTANRIELRQALYSSDSKPTDAQRKAFSRSLKKLQSSGRICVEQISSRASDEDIISLTH